MTDMPEAISASPDMLHYTSYRHPDGTLYWLWYDARGLCWRWRMYSDGMMRVEADVKGAIPLTEAVSNVWEVLELVLTGKAKG